MSTETSTDVAHPLQGRRVACVGKLGGVTLREWRQMVALHGGQCVEPHDAEIDLIVVGADEWPPHDTEELLDDSLSEAVAAGRVEVITETQLWQRLGMVEGDHDIRRLYTPAMLAELLGVSVAVVRRWARRGLIVPVREVNRLPYFDFQEVATARRLAELVAAGASTAAIEKKLAELARLVPEVERPLAQLSVIVEGKQLLLRQGEGLLETGGQLRLDFEAAERPAADEQSSDHVLDDSADVLPMAHLAGDSSELNTPAEIVQWAAELEDEGHLHAAAEMYRAALAVGGPSAEINFNLAELLYRMGDVTAARERYYAAIELDEDYVEARANLGCVLVETGQAELAVAAFEGVLACHEEYPDVHYHLARALDDLDQPERAETHWSRFLELAADSPWAREAEARLAGKS